MTRARRKIHHFGSPGLAAALAVMLAGCASVPPPIQLMDRAQSETRAARSAGATVTAPEALAEAERRLDAAQQFSASGDNSKAADKAQEAEAAAATARARAEVAQLGRQIQQQASVNASLRDDLERRQAAAAAAQQAAVAPAAAASSAPANAPVDLPPVQLDQPGTPAPAPATSTPAPASSGGAPDSGVNP